MAGAEKIGGQGFWSSDAAADFHKMKNFKVMEFPRLVAAIEKLNPKTFLDYGCGSGLIDTMLDPKMKKHLFDTNLKNIVIENPAGYNCKIIERAEDLPGNYYDAVLLAFVLVCVPDEASYGEILANVKRAKKPGGTLFIMNPHPCFRQYDFSYFTGEKTKDFPYLSYGEPYEKHIIDSDGAVVSFTDYHWPLSFTVNKLAEHGLNVVRMEEIPDAGFGARARNEVYPPLLYIECK